MGKVALCLRKMHWEGRPDPLSVRDAGRTSARASSPQSPGSPSSDMGEPVHTFHSKLGSAPEPRSAPEPGLALEQGLGPALAAGPGLGAGRARRLRAAAAAAASNANGGSGEGDEEGQAESLPEQYTRGFSRKVLQANLGKAKSAFVHSLEALERDQLRAKHSQGDSPVQHTTPTYLTLTLP